MKLRTASVCLLSFAVLAPATADAATGVPNRESDPIVITGDKVPALLGAAPGSVVAFNWTRDGGWQQVPVQVDERKVVNYNAVRQGHQAPANRTFDHLAYADASTFAGADPDATVDSDDEIAAMALDAGEGAPMSAGFPGGVSSGSRSELRTVDSVDPGPTRFLYLFTTNNGLDPSAGRDYVKYDFNVLSGDYKTTYDFSGVPNGDSSQSGPPGNPENSSVSTDYYDEHFGARWITDALNVRAGSGVDILDGDKAQVSFGCSRSELTFSRGGGGFIANIDGPVRAIRSYIGSNSGTFTQRDQIFYQRSQVDSTFLRVHPGISTITQYLDYSASATGMTYRNSAAPAGVTIDGVPDPSIQTGTASGTPFVWEQSTGAQGTLSIVSRLQTDMPGIGVGSYYEDSPTPDYTQCSGYADNRTYGASGLALTNAGQNTDPTLGSAYNFTGTRTIFFSGPGGDAALGAKRSSQVDAPLEVSLGTGNGDGDALLKTRLGKNKRVQVGKRVKVNVGLSNEGATDTGRIKVCARGSKKLVRIGKCVKVDPIAPGEDSRAKIKVTLRTAKTARLKVTIESDGLPTEKRKLKLHAR